MTVEGKTKIVTPLEGNRVRLETKDRLSAGDAARVSGIEGIGRLKTDQAENVFSLLSREGVPTAFESREDETSLICAACDMVPLEIVVRRIAWGSYFARHPEARRPARSGVPEPFVGPLVELFHKNALVLKEDGTFDHIPEAEARAAWMTDGAWSRTVYTDPYVVAGPGDWALYPAKQPVTGPPLMMIPPVLSALDWEEVREQIILPAFLTLEKAFSDLTFEGDPITLVDAKFEVGRRKSDGAFVLADVVDNDAWRIWPGGDPGRQLDKQNFREGMDGEEIRAMYETVAALTAGFKETGA